MFDSDRPNSICFFIVYCCLWIFVYTYAHVSLCHPASLDHYSVSVTQLSWSLFSLGHSIFLDHYHRSLKQHYSAIPTLAHTSIPFLFFYSGLRHWSFQEAGSVSSRGLSSVRSGSSLVSTDTDSFCSSCEWGSGSISNSFGVNTNNSNSLDHNNRAARDSLDHRNSQPILDDDDHIEEKPELRFHEHCDNTSPKSPQLHSLHHRGKRMN